METPFIFGKIATEKNFTDREKETADLVQNFTSLINTIIISPRRWGKSSLVNKAARLAMAQDINLRICHIDLFNVRAPFCRGRVAVELRGLLDPAGPDARGQLQPQGSVHP